MIFYRKSEEKRRSIHHDDDILYSKRTDTEFVNDILKDSIMGSVISSKKPKKGFEVFLSPINNKFKTSSTIFKQSKEQAD